jgi:hypothetical protein
MREHDGLPPDYFKGWQDEVFHGQEKNALLKVPKKLD